MGKETNYAALYYAAAGHSPETLENQVAGYPASSLARFLLLYHQKKTGDPGFDHSAGQIGIYINNPSWIRYQLSQPATGDPRTEESTVSSESMAGGGNGNGVYPEFTDPAVGQESPLVNKRTDGHGDHALDTGAEEENGQGHEKNSPSPSDGGQDAEDIREEGPLPSFIPVSLHSSSQETADQVARRTEEEPAPELPADDPGSPSSAITGLEDAKGSGDPGEALAFEPLHTVDYFASQGIKISEESLENDQLGRQVKSFTAWLKSMKKLHPGQLPEQNEVIEKIIQSSAEASNHEANVLTEAMAEVLVKQDKKEKAVEMYEKLSLLNPSKSAYFAAKIESLKSS